MFEPPPEGTVTLCCAVPTVPGPLAPGQMYESDEPFVFQAIDIELPEVSTDGDLVTVRVGGPEGAIQLEPFHAVPPEQSLIVSVSEPDAPVLLSKQEKVYVCGKLAVVSPKTLVKGTLPELPAWVVIQAPATPSADVRYVGLIAPSQAGVALGSFVIVQLSVAESPRVIALALANPVGTISRTPMNKIVLKRRDEDGVYNIPLV